eukprot:1178040-Prorocentrum_minimum.AAC.1
MGMILDKLREAIQRVNGVYIRDDTRVLNGQRELPLWQSSTRKVECLARQSSVSRTSRPTTCRLFVELPDCRLWF